MELELAGHPVRAVSVGGMETCVELPGFDLCFDIGRCPQTAIRQRTLLITHGHVDHLGGLVHHISLRALLGMSPSRVVLPASIVEDVRAMLELWRRIARSELPCELVAAHVGEPVALGKGRTAHPLRASHRVPTLAYVVSTTRRRLLPEFQGLPGAELRRLRASGELVTEEFAVDEVAFSADSRAALLDREPRMRNARLLIAECTFLGSDAATVGRADRTGHMRLEDFAARADRLHNAAILLTHFSPRYAPERVREAVAALPEGLRERVTALL